MGTATRGWMRRAAMAATPDRGRLVPTSAPSPTPAAGPRRRHPGFPSPRTGRYPRRSRHARCSRLQSRARRARPSTMKPRHWRADRRVGESRGGPPGVAMTRAAPTHVASPTRSSSTFSKPRRRVAWRRPTARSGASCDPAPRATESRDGPGGCARSAPRRADRPVGLRGADARAAGGPRDRAAAGR